MSYYTKCDYNSYCRYDCCDQDGDCPWLRSLCYYKKPVSYYYDDNSSTLVSIIVPIVVFVVVMAACFGYRYFKNRQALRQAQANNNPSGQTIIVLNDSNNQTYGQSGYGNQNQSTSWGAQQPQQYYGAQQPQQYPQAQQPQQMMYGGGNAMDPLGFNQQPPPVQPYQQQPGYNNGPIMY